MTGLSYTYQECWELDSSSHGQGHIKSSCFFQKQRYHVDPQSTNFSCNGQRVNINILAFADHQVTVPTTLPCLCNEGSHRQYVNHSVWLYSHTTSFTELGCKPYWAFRVYSLLISVSALKISDSRQLFLIFYLITPENNQRDFDVEEQEFRLEGKDLHHLVVLIEI